MAAATRAAATSEWKSACRYRVVLNVQPAAVARAHSPVSVEIDFQSWIAQRGSGETFDEHTLEVVAPPTPGRVPHRLDRLFGSSLATLHFVLPDARRTNVIVYFDTLESRRGTPRRYHGLVGDGDKFVEDFSRREIAASHFDQFVDFDGDGDLDLFKGGVEPFVYCWENVGRNRLIARGRLSSGGKLLTLPHSRSHRSWLTVAFHDLDGDGDQDFLPSFGDGPDSGQIVFHRNTTREHAGQLTFTRVGPLQTTGGLPLAGGAQAGGWFPSIAFARDWDGDGAGPDALVGSNHRCWLYRDAGTNADGSPRFLEPAALEAGGKPIELVNPRFDCADLDADGDLDLFAGTQPGAVHFFRNIGTGAQPALAPGIVVAWSGRYLIGDAHSGVKVADFDGDGLPDLASGRFWERADLQPPDQPHDFGGLWKNTGARHRPRFERHHRAAPFTEQFQACDATRQNGLRAVDWNRDGRLDLLAGDTDGFLWLFRNHGDRAFPVFTPGERLQTNGGPLNVTATGGHARFDVADWDNDGRNDLVIADGSGSVTLFLNHGRPSRPAFKGGTRLHAGGAPIQLGGRASALVCDWNHDGRKDLVLADDKGFYFAANTGMDAAPALALPQPILFAGQRVKYVRPNLGSFVDWDGDGKRDFIAGHFENSIRFYRNLGSGAPGDEPRFADAEGVTLLQGESPQMISGVDAVDWNGDGRADLLTGQGHGGSGLRYYARDWIEDSLRGTHPVVTLDAFERR